MKKEGEPAIIQPLDLIHSVNGDGSESAVSFGYANPEGASLVQKMADHFGFSCEIMSASENGGRSFSLSSVRRDLPFLTGSAWSKNKPKDPSQN